MAHGGAALRDTRRTAGVGSRFQLEDMASASGSTIEPGPARLHFRHPREGRGTGPELCVGRPFGGAFPGRRAPRRSDSSGMRHSISPSLLSRVGWTVCVGAALPLDLRRPARRAAYRADAPVSGDACRACCRVLPGHASCSSAGASARHAFCSVARLHPGRCPVFSPCLRARAWPGGGAVVVYRNSVRRRSGKSELMWSPDAAAGRHASSHRGTPGERHVVPTGGHPLALHAAGRCGLRCHVVRLRLPHGTPAPVGRCRASHPP